jgi:outer membrane protein assembly factor BamB
MVSARTARAGLAARIAATGGLALLVAAGLPVSASADAGPWPQFLGASQHNGLAGTSGPRSLTLAWYQATNDDITASAVIGNDGSVYVTSTGGGVIGVSAEGGLRWTFTAGARIYGSPAIMDDGRIVFGDLNGRVRALNPDGTVSWTLQTRTSMRGTPAIAPPGSPNAGTIYIGADNGQLIAIDADGHEKFRQRAGGAVVGAPAISAAGDVFWSGLDRRLRRTGSNDVQIWDVQLDGDNVSAPAVGPDGTVYVGAGSSIEAINPDSGAVKWRAGVGGAVQTTPAVGPDGTVYAGSENGLFTAVTAGGATKWQVQTGGAVRSSAAVGSDGAVYFGSGDGTFYAFDADGKRLGTYRALDALNGAVAIAPNGNAFVGSNDNRIYAIGDVARHFTESPAERLGGDVVRDPATGRVYVIVGGKRRYIPDPATQAILGLIVTVPQNLGASELVRYPEGPPLPALAEGTLLQAGNGPIYVIRNGKRTWVRSLDEFVKGGYSWDAVIAADERLLRSIPLALDNGFLIKGTDDRIYLVENGQRRWITSAAAFESRGYTWSMVHFVANDAIAALPEGPQV